MRDAVKSGVAGVAEWQAEKVNDQISRERRINHRFLGVVTYGVSRQIFASSNIAAHQKQVVNIDTMSPLAGSPNPFLNRC
jgi:hypothetical protein